MMTAKIKTAKNPEELAAWLNSLNVEGVQEVHFEHQQYKAYLRFELNRFYHNNLLNHPPLKILLILIHQFLLNKPLTTDLTQFTQEEMEKFLIEIKSSPHFCDYQKLMLPSKLAYTQRSAIFSTASPSQGKTFEQAKGEIEQAILSKSFDTNNESFDAKRTWQPAQPDKKKNRLFLGLFSRSAARVDESSRPAEATHKPTAPRGSRG